MHIRKAGALALLYIIVFGTFISVAYWGSVATSVVAQMIPLERDATIIIDAGHGGVDGGATSCTGILESKFNLDISLRLNDLFHLLGYRTVMVRTTDRSIHTQGDTIAAKKISDLRQRVKLCNETEDAVLISIHQNTFSDSRYSGAQVFYPPKGEGQQLAENLQTAFGSTLNPGSSRRCKGAEGVYLMNHIECPGVLIECGFLSNPEEEARLRSPEYQKKLCAVIAATVGEFLSNT